MHPHGHFGAIGAATAVALLTGADPVALARITATQPLLTGWDACYEGATARNTWTGHASRVAVLASILARVGFTGSFASHLSVVAPYATNLAALTEPVTIDTLRIGRNYVKFHSACALNHTSIEALLKAWARIEVSDPRAIRQVTVRTVSANLRVDRLPAPNSLSTRFSLPYAIAAALLTGSTGPDAFIWDGAVANLAERVQISVDPAMDRLWPGKAPARVQIETTTETAEAVVDNPHGHYTQPATSAELRDKFVRLLSGGGETTPGTRPTTVVAPNELASIFDTLAEVNRAADCSALPLPMAPRTNGGNSNEDQTVSNIDVSKALHEESSGEPNRYVI